MLGISTLEENSIQPNLVDIVSDSEIYLGFANNGDETKCAIVKISTTGTEKRFLCPENGIFDFIHNWADRANYLYQLRRI